MAAGVVLCGSLSRMAVPLGAAMHNAAYRALGLDWHYVPFEVHELAPAIAAMRALGIRGLGISVPFKRDILPLLDALDPVAAAIGAVNTVVNDDGRLVGHNTDCTGATRALAEALPPAGARVLVLGAGGAGRAVAFGLREAGAKVTLANRNDGAGAALARELGCAWLPWAERGRADFEALVNATSLGMAGVGLEAPTAGPFPPLVMDIVYKPLATELLRLASERGARTIHGGRMLLHQAAAQHELYTAPFTGGRPAPLDAMDAALMELVEGRAGE
jgi:shikimate dehydrogenase